MKRFTWEMQCPKCGSTAAHGVTFCAAFCAAGPQPERSLICYLRQCEGHPEDRMHRQCATCAFLWDEVPLDAAERAQDDPAVPTYGHAPRP